MSDRLDSGMEHDLPVPAGHVPLPAARSGANGFLGIGDLAREFDVTLRALRFYQSRGLLAPGRNGNARQFTAEDCERLTVVLQGKRLGFTLTEVRKMMSRWQPGKATSLPISRKECVEQINLLERQRRDLDRALEELRRIYTGMLPAPGADTKAKTAR